MGQTFDLPSSRVSGGEDESTVQSVAKLNQINQLVENALRLSSSNDPEAFLEALVRVLSESIGASPVTLFEHDPVARTLAMRIHFSDGEIRRGLSGVEVPLFAAPFRTDITPTWAEAIKLEGRFLSSARIPLPEELVWPGVAEWMARLGVCDRGLMILMVGDEPIGALGLSWRNGRSLNVADCPFVEAMGRQAAVALRMVQLSDLARDAAAARASERAARAYAAELVLANNSLQRSISLLTQQGNPVAFLENVLAAATAACGAVSAGVTRHDASADSLQLVAWVSQGQPLDISTDPRMSIWRIPYPAGHTPGWSLLVNDELLWFDNLDEDGWCPIVAEWHHKMGHRMIAFIPLRVNGSALGYLSLCFAQPVQPTELRLAQARTLAAHAALALQLTRLAEDVRREAAAAAALAERNRIARDLHDTLAQGFTGILAQLGVVEGALDARDRPPNELYYALGRAAELARTALDESRRAVRVLREESEPPSESRAPTPPLAVVLAELLERMTTGTRLGARLEIEEEVPALPPRTEEILRRIAQEALTNSLKHAGPEAREFFLQLVCRKGLVTLLARDNGCGFDPQSVSAASDGLGLVGMRERVALVGGRATIRSTPGEGTEITVELPITHPSE